MDKFITISQRLVPRFFYGTAWKEDKTLDLTQHALETGFRAIDTANQRKHYFEEAVGKTITHACARGLKREELFIQTKFTYANGQDHRKPYDEQADFSTQVQQSFQSSLEHLKIDYCDSYVLHGPYDYYNGITDEDLETWTSMENLYEKGQIKFLGISNVSIFHLQELMKRVKIKPTFVQNRCFARNKWDFDVRNFCNQNKIYYQGFSLLTANIREISSEPIKKIVLKYRKTIPQIIFNFSMTIGMIPLTGTTNSIHMQEDLESFNFMLDKEDIEVIENIGS